MSRNRAGEDGIFAERRLYEYPDHTGPIQCCERLGRLLRYYAHEAA